MIAPDIKCLVTGLFVSPEFVTVWDNSMSAERAMVKIKAVMKDLRIMGKFYNPGQFALTVDYV